MKFIVIGLGNFGASLSNNLTMMGHEVIGVDNNPEKVAMQKDFITSSICLNTTEQSSLDLLPLDEADAVIVAIGEDFGAAVMTTALLKQKKVKRLIGRATSEIHKTVLRAIDVDEILNPEADSADRTAKRLEIKNAIDSFCISGEYYICEIIIPGLYVNKSIADCDLKGRLNLNLIAVKRKSENNHLLSKYTDKEKVFINPENEFIFEENDIIVVFGKFKDIKLVFP